MSNRGLGTLLCVFLSFFASGIFAGPVTELERIPLDDIYAFDRIDLEWSLNISDLDSVVVDFGDGSKVALEGDADEVRYFYSHEGIYDVSITAWIDGHNYIEHRADQIRVQRRVVPGLNVMFLHHSTGRLLIKDSGFRSLIDWHNEISGTDIRFWDHDYAFGNDHTGVILPDSTVYLDWIYGYEANNIQPVGYYEIFCEAPAFRDSLFSRHDVIVFKNDHRTGDIETDEELQEHKNNYLEIRNVLDQFPDKLFIMVSGSSRRPEKTTNAMADRAREFYDWMQSPQFMNGHSNIAFFDLFDALSNPDDSSDPERNMLRAEYRRDATWDDHPSEEANRFIGPQAAEYLLRTLDPDFFFATSAAPLLPATRANLYDAVPNPFNPVTKIAWELDQPSLVTLRIFDVSGRLIRTLVESQVQIDGLHEVVWRGNSDSGRPQPSGVYFYRLDAGSQTATKRMTLVR
jgi:hypothetical protein